MTELLSIVPLGLLLFAYLLWGFRTLPKEQWQFVATVPLIKDADGHWRGINLTYYGLFSAAAYVAAVSVLLVLLGAIGVTPAVCLALVFGVLLVCVPASRIVAAIVERKQHTFSVAGAFFVALFAVPGVISLLNAVPALHQNLPYLSVMAAAAITYAFGEGLGRLSCISFGCCYGKRLEETAPWVRRLFTRWHFVFAGPTKKIAYASGMDGVRVLPVQGLTAIINVVTGLVGVWLYLRGLEHQAVLVTLAVTQLWRYYSETLRADYRGGGRISAYQWMSLAGVLYAVLAATLMPAAVHHKPALLAGVAALWSPGTLLFLQAVGVIIFIYTGRSSVTESRVSVHVCKDRI
jgi:hypothetical protein